MNEDLSVWQWIATHEGERAVGSMPISPTTAQMSKLRATLSLEQVGVVSQVAIARSKAMRKLDQTWTNRLIADVAGVEMASSALSSLHKANRLASALGAGALIADLCCGIGADSWGFLQRELRVVGVDVDPIRAWMFQHNTGSRSIVGDAVDACPSDIVAFHLDPARRTVEGKRTLELDDFLPGPSEWSRLMNTHPTGVIKLNPGVNAYELPDGECEILSEPNGLTQALLWVGNLAGDSSRRATKLLADGTTSTVHGEPDRPEDSCEVGPYIATLDPCLERADLVGSFLDETGLELVYPGTGLVSADEPIEHAMARWHRVVEVLPWNRKRVKSALRALDTGIVEIRTRGGVVNPDIEQRQLRGKGSNNHVTVLIYRIDDRVMSIVTERVDDEALTRKNPCIGGAARALGELDDD